ncbi:hypothetical protein [Terribacillus saccharophilus]|uniref:hypothetical protein n=1 Tax=Terribacillus saccharophilus TaxID=361277 RepID=UPI00398269FB
MREIGSEFWLEDEFILENDYPQLPSWLELGFDNRLVLSGRTAIDLILEDLKPQIKDDTTVYFPSYCCDSMLQPFIERDINVEFYEVYFDKGLKYKIDLDEKCDIFFAMNYFGFTESNMNDFILAFKRKGITVIEDVTHSLLSKCNAENYSHYKVASIRKWFPILSGGLAVKIEGSFTIETCNKTNNKMIQSRYDAMALKKKYIHDYQINYNLKEIFLNLYKEANDNLNKNYRLFAMDKKSINILANSDINSIIEKRRENASVILDYINENKGNDIIPVFSNLKDEDCPLFVPIIIEQNNRKKLREFLSKNNIFLPVHWGKPVLIKGEYIQMYDRELSIVCDQRYDTQDMEYTLKLMDTFVRSL